MNRKEINLGIFGFGCVGYGLWQVLEQTPGLKTKIKKIGVKDKNKSRPIHQDYFTYDPFEILNDPEINVIVELIDDSEAAFLLVKKALENGKAVVTANKKMIAEHFQELLSLQETHQVPLLYEAAVCASIPIIRNLEEYYDNDLLEKIEGIINGSTNFILSKTHQENLSYNEALALAQKLGFAESNPALDTEGWDSKYKLIILIMHAFGVALEPHQISHFGIDRINPLVLKLAKEKNWQIKLLGHACRTKDQKLQAFVIPQFVSEKNLLHQVQNEYNGVLTQTSFSEKQFFMGKGAGAYPTASAVLSDISALSYDYKYEYKKKTQEKKPVLNNEHFLTVLIGYETKKGIPNSLKLSNIQEQFQNTEYAYTIADVELKNLSEVYLDHNFCVVGMEH